MPSMASITVKKADGVTDIVFDALAASGGENSPAMWRQDTGAAAGLPVGLRSMVRMTTRWNGPKTARVAQIEMSFPYATQDSTTTLYSSRDQGRLSATVILPQGMPAAALNEFAYQAMNLMASTLFKSALAAGYAPT